MTTGLEIVRRLALLVLAAWVLLSLVHAAGGLLISHRMDRGAGPESDWTLGMPVPEGAREVRGVRRLLEGQGDVGRVRVYVPDSLGVDTPGGDYLRSQLGLLEYPARIELVTDAEGAGEPGRTIRILSPGIDAPADWGEPVASLDGFRLYR